MQPVAPGATPRAGESQNYSYYKEFCRLHCAHAILNEKLAALISEKEELA